MDDNKNNSLSNFIKYIQQEYPVVLIINDNYIIYNFDNNTFGFLAEYQNKENTIVYWNTSNEKSALFGFINKFIEKAHFYIINDNIDYNIPYDVENNDQMVIYKGIISINLSKIIDDMMSINNIPKNTIVDITEEYVDLSKRLDHKNTTKI